MNIIVMGPPGAGKGTQADMLVNRFDVPHISTGDIFRMAIKEETKLGLKAKAFIEAGQLVTDEVTIGIVRERLSAADCKKGFLLDGFPRTVTQAIALKEILEKIGGSLDSVINIDVPNQILLKRITGRLICRQCGATYNVDFKPASKYEQCDKCGGGLYQRDDDREDVVIQRLKVYNQQTEPLIGYYRQQELLTDINGDQESERVFEDICLRLESKA